MPPCDVWLQIEGYSEQLKLSWEQTRSICFTVAKFGNSDPKGFPKNPQTYWPLPWDSEIQSPNTRSILESHARMEAKRKLLETNNKAKS